MKFILLLAAIVSIFSAAAEVFTIPHNPCTPILDGKADEEVWKNLPYQGDSFTRIGTKEKVAAQTRFKPFTTVNTGSFSLSAWKIKSKNCVPPAAAELMR